MYTTPRTMVSGRIPEYLENLKVEFESLAHDVNLYKMQRDDYERKLQAQLGELNNIQQTLYDLERNHTKIKQQYEEEIMRLRRQLEMQTSGGSSASTLQNFPSRSVSPPGANGVPPVQLPVGANTISNALNPTQGTGPLPSVGSGPSAPGVFYPGLAPIETKRPPFPMSPGIGPLTPSVMNPVTQPPIAPTPPVPIGASISSNLNTPSKRPRESEIYPTIAEKQHKPDIESDKSKLERKTYIDSAKDDMSNKMKTPEEGADWIVGYNPGVQTNLNIDLSHTLEHNSVVCCVKFSNDGKCLATGCNKSAQIFDVETGEKIHIFQDESGKETDLYIRSVCFSPNNRFLAAGAEDKTVKIWDIENKRLHHTFMGHELDIYSLDYSKDGQYVVSGSGDKRAKIWDVEKGECLFTLGNEEVGPKDGVTSVAFSPDGKLVAAGSLDRIVRLWDAHTGYFLERYEGHTDSVYSVAFSPDGKSLASGSLDKTLKLWDLAGSRSRSRCKSTFTGHKDFVLSVAFSPDGNWLISGSKDRSVQFWDPRSAVTHMMLQGHKNSVISVAVSPTGGVFATGSGDYRARIWKFDSFVH